MASVPGAADGRAGRPAANAAKATMKDRRLKMSPGVV